MEKLIIYYANQKNKLPHLIICLTINLYLFCYDNPSSQIKYKEPMDKSVLKSSNGVYRYDNPFCHHCYSRKVVKTGYNTRKTLYN